MELTPCMMVANEEYWIYPILRELTTVFPKVVVFDTGSTDNTKKIIKKHFADSVHLVEREIKDLYAIGALKTEIFKTAGYPVLKVDGDEYYSREVLQHFKELEVGEEKAMGFSSQWTIGVREDGHQLFRREGKNTDAIFLKETTWHNHYPFEGNSWWELRDTHFYTDGNKCGLHLHHLHRSDKDGETYYRANKKEWYAPTEDHGDINIADLVFPDDILREYNPYFQEGHPLFQGK